MELKEELLSNIILEGGNTMFPGIEDRLQRELESLYDGEQGLRVIAPPERKYSVWIGGSIVSSLSAFSRLCMTMEDYNEFGPTVVHRQCF